ncbi:calcium-binding protein [Rhodobacter lacus]|uniref:Calcium-binding protein n=1 Tax=Rhodobacter lacus TaxID=1641972 RepID=A0ABW5A4R6_9RHOB
MPIEDDYANTMGQGQTIDIGSGKFGFIQPTSDQDWFLVDLVAGESYVFAMEVDEASLLFALHDPDGTRVAQGGTVWDEDGDEFVTTSLIFTAETSGSYALGVMADPEIEQYGGSYDISVDLAPETTGILTVEMPVEGTIDVADEEDWFDISFVPETVYRLTVRPDASNGTPLDTDYVGLYVYDASVSELDADYASDDGLSATFKTASDLENGLIAVSGSVTGDYIVTLEALSDDIADGMETTVTLASGESVTSALDYAWDEDWFIAQLVAGKTYRFELVGDPQSTTPASVSISEVHLYDAQGTEIEAVIDGLEDCLYVGDGAQVAFVSVAWGSDHGEGIGDYLVSVTEVADDLPASTATTAELTPQGPALGRIDYAYDEDWFYATLTPGDVWRISVAPDPNSDTPLAGTAAQPITLYDATGAEISSGWGAIEYLSSDDAPIYIGIGGSDVNNDTTGDYQIRLVNLSAADDFGSSLESASPITPNSFIAGEIGYEIDEDWFAITLQEGSSYAFQLLGRITGTNNPYATGALRWSDLTLIGPDGSAITEGFSLSETYVSGRGERTFIEGFVAPVAGTYYLCVAPASVLPLTGGYGLRVFEEALTAAAQTGTEASDKIVSGSGDDVLTGLGGEDWLDGGAGDDSIAGDTGNDMVMGRAGNDTLSGGAGADQIAGNTGDDSLDGGAGNDLIGAGAGNDTIRAGTGNDTVRAGGGDDTVYGGEGDDDIRTGSGHDYVEGGTGNDTLFGNRGDDTLLGGTGDDVLIGGRGDDILNGGTGNDLLVAGRSVDVGSDAHGSDQFVFDLFTSGESDTIRGFELHSDDWDGTDQIVLSGVTSNAGTDAAALLAALSITDTEAGAEILYLGHRILVEGILAADLGLDEIVFV